MILLVVKKGVKMKILGGIMKYVLYYITGTAICTALWYLLFGRDDNGKKKLENGKEAVNA